MARFSLGYIGAGILRGCSEWDISQLAITRLGKQMQDWFTRFRIRRTTAFPIHLNLMPWSICPPDFGERLRFWQEIE
jgi:hypothetical protein